eukprot:GHVT01023808.1.p1 GENE.GHVT01023808.1~~GHVT01023808.1.p1  ORF type:complete len:292 (-),score=21.04 GHVT01023808.1:1005-1880(-)
MKRGAQKKTQGTTLLRATNQPLGLNNALPFRAQDELATTAKQRSESKPVPTGRVAPGVGASGNPPVASVAKGGTSSKGSTKAPDLWTPLTSRGRLFCSRKHFGRWAIEGTHCGYSAAAALRLLPSSGVDRKSIRLSTVLQISPGGTCDGQLGLILLDVIKACEFGSGSDMVVLSINTSTREFKVENLEMSKFSTLKRVNLWDDIRPHVDLDIAVHYEHDEITVWLDGNQVCESLKLQRSPLRSAGLCGLGVYGRSRLLIKSFSVESLAASTEPDRLSSGAIQFPLDINSLR